MNTQKTSVLFAGIFALVLFTGLAIAVLLPGFSLSGPTTPIPFMDDEVTLTLTNTANTNLTDITFTPSISGITFNPPTISNLPNVTNNTVSVDMDFSAIRNSLKFGNNAVTVTAKADERESNTLNLNIQKSFCKEGSVGDLLEIDRVSVDNRGTGDDFEWELLDEIRIEVRVDNLDEDNRIDATVVLGLFDSSGRDFARDLDFLPGSDGDEEEIDVRISKGERETVEFLFRVPPDFDVEDYRLAIKVYDEDEGETDSCADSSADLDEDIYQEVSIIEKSEEEDFIAIDDIVLSSSLACGETASGSFTVFNVGEDDQDRVLITLRNAQLNLEQTFEITSGLDVGDSERFNFAFPIPSNINSGFYGLEFIPDFDYRSGVYRERGNSETIPLEVFGCQGGNGDNNGNGNAVNALVRADLDSDAVAGEELVVLATITNTGNSDSTFVLATTNYQDWADSASLSKRIIDLESGETTTVEITLKVSDSASGRKSFTLQVVEGSNTKDVEIEVNIQSSGFNGFNFDFTGNSGLIWIIAIINIILIVLIIVVAVRLARR